MDPKILDKIEESRLKKRPEIKVGDTVKLHMKIQDGDSYRIQIFEGIVISLKGRGMSKTITVRKISMGVGVERIVPLHSPKLDKVEVVKRGTNVRKSKLYYMRERVGRRAMKIRGGVGDLYLTDEEELSPEELEAAGVDETEVKENADAKVEAENSPDSAKEEA